MTDARPDLDADDADLVRRAIDERGPAATAWDLFLAIDLQVSVWAAHDRGRRRGAS